MTKQRGLSKLEQERLNNKLQEIKRYMLMVQDILPEEEKSAGSACRIIDNALNMLYYKYVNQGSE